MSHPNRVYAHWQGYTPEDEEDSAVATVSAVWVYQARYRIPPCHTLTGFANRLAGLHAGGRGGQCGGDRERGVGVPGALPHPTMLHPNRVYAHCQGCTPEDEEDSAVATVSAVWVYQARYRIPPCHTSTGYVPLAGLHAGG